MQSTGQTQTAVVNNQNLLDRLNQEQKEAVCLKWGPSLVVAGAGSGKTTVLTRRVAFLLSELKQPASSILAVTFTNKAAQEMKKRLEQLVGERTAKHLSIGTFHSICARLLRQEIEEFKSSDGHRWNKNFVIYDETDSLSLVKDAVSKLNLDEKMYAPREMRNRISSFKNDGISAGEYAQDARRYADQKFSEIFSAYQASLARNNALDFDDLILIMSQLLEQNEAVRKVLQERFRHVLVDEFQDTNQSQYRLIRMISAQPPRLSQEGLEEFWKERSLMVVGDVDQSIYSWRKADFRIILGFQNDYQSSRMIKLEENYRSTSTILDVANDIIKNNSERIDKVLRCNRGKGGKIRVNAGSDEIDEAYFVAEELRRLTARGMSLSNCAILYRTNALSRALEEVLVRSHIPYTMVGGTRFYERAEIKDILAYLKFIYNPKDSQAFLRCIGSPKRGIGKTSLEHLLNYAQDADISPLQACLSAGQIGAIAGKAGKALLEFGLMAEGWRQAADVIPVSELIKTVLKQSGFFKKLKEDADSSKDELAAGRIENVEELIAVAEDFLTIADEPTLEAFLTRISLVSDLDALKEGQDAVKLMTLHAAKGLEFQNVFLIGLEEGLFPHSRARDSEKDLEEERRLMYVGVTRAEERLYLSLARKRVSYAQGGFSNYTIPSRFLSEISPDHLMGLDSVDLKEADSSYDSRYSGSSSGSYSGRSSWKAESNSGSSYGQSRPSASGFGSSYGQSRPSASGSGSSYGQSRPAASGSGSSYGQPRRPASNPTPAAKPRVLGRLGPKESSSPAQDAPESSSSSRSISPESNYERLKAGDQVMHTKFGIGSIQEVIGEGDKELYAVKFEGFGKRILDPRFAKLVKMS